jgi:hypothetical protein
MKVTGTATGDPLTSVDIVVDTTVVTPRAGRTDGGFSITIVTGTGIGVLPGPLLIDIETTVIGAFTGTTTGLVTAPGITTGGTETGGAETDGGAETGGEAMSIGRIEEGMTEATDGLTTSTGGMLGLEEEMELITMLGLETIDTLGETETIVEETGGVIDGIGDGDGDDDEYDEDDDKTLELRTEDDEEMTLDGILENILDDELKVDDGIELEELLHTFG